MRPGGHLKKVANLPQRMKKLKKKKTKYLWVTMSLFVNT